eukprot:scaffold91206_cov28-Tisochrysis_lutea.AAC.3
MLPLSFAAAEATVPDVFHVDARLFAMPFMTSMAVKTTPTTIKIAKAIPEVCVHGGKEFSSAGGHEDSERASPGCLAHRKAICLRKCDELSMARTSLNMTSNGRKFVLF